MSTTVADQLVRGLVDAGVGVKTGVNYGMGKNRLGTDAPAIATYVDRAFLRTLDDRHLSNGLAEILKMALIKSVDLFELLETYGQRLIDDNFQGASTELDTAATQVIAESIHLMLEELQPNLWESCLERCVDYGHTFSPTLEMEAACSAARRGSQHRHGAHLRTRIPARKPQQ